MDMVKKFNTVEAIEYCKNSNVNMLVADKHFKDETAVFKLYSVSEDLIMHYLVEGLEPKDDRIISVDEIAERNSEVIFIDTSEIKIINGEYEKV